MTSKVPRTPTRSIGFAFDRECQNCLASSCSSLWLHGGDSTMNHWVDETPTQARSVIGWFGALLILVTLGAVIAWVSGAFDPRYDAVSASDYLRSVLTNRFAVTGEFEAKVKRVP